MRICIFKDVVNFYSYINGIFHGLLIANYRNAGVKQISAKTNGKYSGDYREYNYDGRLSTHATMHHDYYRGIVRHYHHSGSLEEIYIAGEKFSRDADACSFKSNGELCTVYQVNGNLGEYCIFRDGKVMLRRYYKNKNKHGVSVSNYGDKSMITYFSNGEDVTKSVLAVVKDVYNITEQEQMDLKLGYNICI